MFKVIIILRCRHFCPVVTATTKSALAADYMDPGTVNVPFNAGASTGTAPVTLSLTTDTLIEGVEYFEVDLAITDSTTMNTGSVLISKSTVLILDLSCK